MFTDTGKVEKWAIKTRQTKKERESKKRHSNHQKPRQHTIQAKSSIKKEPPHNPTHHRPSYASSSCSSYSTHT